MSDSIYRINLDALKESEVESWHVQDLLEYDALQRVEPDDLLVAAAEYIAETQSMYRLMLLVEHVHMRIGHQAVLGGNDEPLPQIPSTA